MIPSELLKKVRRIQIRTAHVVNDVLAGRYHSAFRGRGMEFEEVRQYQIGDDVRTIDWNVSARYGEPYVKLYREERELTVLLAVDVSRSQFFGTTTQLKRDLTTEVCATLAFSAIQNHDKVGLILFSDRVEKYVPPAKGTRQVLRVIRDLLQYEAKGVGTSIGAALEHVTRVSRRRSVVFVVSDFLAPDFEEPLRVARRRHDVIPIVIFDRRENELPDVGLVEVSDLESGQQVMIDTSSRRVREAYARQNLARRESRDRLFRRMNIDLIPIETGQSPVDPLVRFFHARRVRN